MRALRRFTVQAALPEQLSQLHELVMNLRWSWHPASLDLFASIDPVLWRLSGGDPVRLLGAVSPERLAQLAGDAEFRARLDAAADDLRAELGDMQAIEARARRVVERMALVLQGSLVVRYGDEAVADAFCASRLGGDWGTVLGTLPAGIPAARLVARSTVAAV